MISMMLVIANEMIAVIFLFFSSVYFLQSPEYFGLEQAESAKVAGDLIFYTYPFAIIFDMTSGYIYTIFGRKWPIFFGNMLSCVMLILIPLTIKTIYPGLFLAMVAINFAHSLPKNHPLISDYIKGSSRGTATALVTVASSLGALVSIKFLFGELKYMDYLTNSIIVSAVNFIISIFLLFGVKDVHKPIN